MPDLVGTIARASSSERRVRPSAAAASPISLHRRPEQLAVLGLLDRRRGCAPISSTPCFVEHARARRASIARLSAVWPPSVGSSASGRSRSMIFSTALDRDRLDVGAVRELRVGHDRRRVRVDQDDRGSPLRAAPCRPACPSSRTRRPGRSRSARSRSPGSCGCRCAWARPQPPRPRPARSARRSPLSPRLVARAPSRGSARRSSRRRAGPATPRGGTAPRRSAASRARAPRRCRRSGSRA